VRACRFGCAESAMEGFLMSPVDADVDEVAGEKPRRMPIFLLALSNALDEVLAAEGGHYGGQKVSGVQ